MCTSRRSHMPRPFAWMVTVLAVFVFALAPGSFGAVYLTDGTGGTEGDPGDGHNATGGGGSSFSDLFNQDTNDIEVKPAKTWIVFIDRFVPVFLFDGNRLTVSVIRFEIPMTVERAEGGK